MDNGAFEVLNFFCYFSNCIIWYANKQHIGYHIFRLRTFSVGTSQAKSLFWLLFQIWPTLNPTCCSAGNQPVCHIAWTNYSYFHTMFSFVTHPPGAINKPAIIRGMDPSHQYKLMPGKSWFPNDVIAAGRIGSYFQCKKGLTFLLSRHLSSKYTCRWIDVSKSKRECCRLEGSLWCS